MFTHIFSQIRSFVLWIAMGCRRQEYEEVPTYDELPDSPSDLTPNIILTEEDRVGKFT